MSQKYKLFSAPSDGKAICAFFSSPAGCRNGEKCKFSHEKASASVQVSDSPHDCSSSVISSESEDDVNATTIALASSSTPTKNTTSTNKISTSTAEDKKSQNSKKKKRRGDSDIFAKAKGDTLSPTPAKKQKLASSNVSPKPVKHNEPNKKSKSTSNRKEKQKQPCTDFRNLDLPVASFSVLEKDKTPKKASENEKSPASKNSKDSNTNGKKKDSGSSLFPLPTSSDVGRKWKDVVIKTREHKSYSTCYDFEKWKQLDEANGVGSTSDWIKARPYGEWSKNNPQAIAIDCEMCETKDPVTGNPNHKALCRLSVVNAENPEETLLDTLVKPEWPVTNYRTWVNGIKKEDLDNVQFTLRHAQAFMFALCSEETVIIGQSLENDLCALRLEHHCNADSANLFVAKDDNNSTPGLKDIAKAVLNEDMPETHDSVNDAITALRCLEFYIEHDGKVEPIERMTQVRNKFASSQLFVHRIPKICSTDHLESLFLNHTWVSPLKIDNIELTGQHGKTVVTFKSSRHANLAFFTLEGDQDSDSSGRAQKKVFLRSGSYIRVRKMVHDKKKPQEEMKEVESEN